MSDTYDSNVDREAHARFSRRMQWLTILFGAAAATATLFLKPRRYACGIAAGALLAWLNYRWLDRGLGALETAALAQQGRPHPRVPLSVYVKFGGRYLLIGVAAYVIVSYFGVPLLAILLGLLALGAAAMAEGLYQVFSGTK
jgi:hypothetical protein